MRLLNTTTYRFSEFFDKKVPPYAILSHRWGDQEISFQDLSEDKVKSGHGYDKVIGFCDFAKAQYEWVWVDTCCIDKKSSAELTQAINSMYTWYENAEVCYVYLEDMSSKGHSMEECRGMFRRSVWFRRGWTLQELLAPSEVIFCTRDWEEYGSRFDLAQDISITTGIAKAFLIGDHDPRDASIAMRMSWSSKRHTTRPEDLAYCLLGLFDINMPLLYGEGQKAFMRLQLEIIRKSDDESIFAWQSNQRTSGMLASSPESFKDCGTIVNIPLSPEERMPYFMTNKGLQIQSSSNTGALDKINQSTGLPMGYPYHIVELGCFYGGEEGIIDDDQDAEEMWEAGAVTIELARLGPSWTRINCHSLGTAKNSGRCRREDGAYAGRGVQRVYIVHQPDL